MSLRHATPPATARSRFRRAESAADRKACGDLLYRVYVEERGCDEPRADHFRRTIDLDPKESATDLVAEHDGRIVGMVRLQVGTQIPTEARRFYAADRFPGTSVDRVSVTTKLVVEPAFRRSRITRQLVRLGFEAYLHAGIRHTVVDCNEPRLSFFRRLGYVPYLPVAEHPIYGRVHRMALDLHDLDHLVAVRSPFRDLVASFGTRTAPTAPWLGRVA